MRTQKKKCENKEYMRRSREWESWFRSIAKNIWIFVWKIDRFLEQAKTKRYWFRKRMLFQTFRIWSFRVFINRRVLIDCRFWAKSKDMTHRRRTDDCENDELNWLRDRLTLIVVFHLFMSCALVSLLWCNRFIF